MALGARSSASMVILALLPATDMGVSKIARNDTHTNTVEVLAGTKFYYNISVTNPSGHDASEVVVTDKLPYDVIYGSAKAQASNGAALTNATINIDWRPALRPFPANPQAKDI